MNVDPAVDDPEELRRLYWDEWMSQSEIADIAGCSRPLVSKRMKQFGIKRRPRGNQMSAEVRQYLEDANCMRAQYVEQERLTTDIADELGCTHQTVAKYLRKHGIDVHTRGFRPGEDHPLYKGGQCEEFGPNWYRQRKRAIERDNRTCQRCGVEEDTYLEQYQRGLNVHHIRPRSEFIEDGTIDHERANALENLVTLCHACHKKLEGLPIDNREVAV